MKTSSCVDDAQMCLHLYISGGHVIHCFTMKSWSAIWKPVNLKLVVLKLQYAEVPLGNLIKYADLPTSKGSDLIDLFGT